MSAFEGFDVPSLGFGALRLPVKADGSIDSQMVFEMVDYAIDHGVKYFDTAFPYHDGKSEVVIGEALRRHPRESWLLADKYPGHQHSALFDPAGTFERQLRRCGVDFFDYYLFHNICENSLADYMEPRWGMLDYFVKQREAGRIRHLGFSSHATADNLAKILDGPYGEVAEFVQIQLNYLDWSLQDARRKCEIIASHGLPVVVMEPVRGGRLANLDQASHERLQALRPGSSDASWAFRWLMDIPGVKVILSGMSNTDHVRDNVTTFSAPAHLSAAERDVLAELAEGMKSSVPCTACRYCTAGCPAELDIPALIADYNDLKVQVSFNVTMRLESLPEEKRPHACLQCGACSQICPQGIAIPDIMTELADIYDKAPKWADICVERNRIADSEAATSS